MRGGGICSQIREKCSSIIPGLYCPHYLLAGYQSHSRAHGAGGNMRLLFGNMRLLSGNMRLLFDRPGMTVASTQRCTPGTRGGVHKVV